MFKNPFKTPEIEDALNEEIASLLAALAKQDKSSQEYGVMSDQLVKLYELRHKSRVSKDALANIAANVLGIIVLMNHERVHVIASKAFSLVKKIG